MNIYRFISSPSGDIIRAAAVPATFYAGFKTTRQRIAPLSLVDVLRYKHNLQPKGIQHSGWQNIVWIKTQSSLINTVDTFVFFSQFNLSLLMLLLMLYTYIQRTLHSLRYLVVYFIWKNELCIVRTLDLNYANGSFVCLSHPHRLFIH